MSAAERAALPGLRVARVELDLIELSALRGQSASLAAALAPAGTPLPPLGRVRRTAQGAALAVRPERWLLLERRAAPGTRHADWARRTGSFAVAVDLSAALAAFWLEGARAAEALARGCRLDLAGFADGAAAASGIAQVGVMLARLADGWLLLTPATTSRHFHEWLLQTGAAFGIEERPPLNLDALTGAIPP